MDPNDHGQVGGLVDARGTDDIEVQAVLGHGVANVVVAVSNAMGRVARGVVRADPARVQWLGDGEPGWFLRPGQLCGTPHPRAWGRVTGTDLCIWHAQEEVLMVLGRVHARVGAVLDRHNRRGQGTLAPKSSIFGGRGKPRTAGCQQSQEPRRHGGDEE